MRILLLGIFALSILSACANTREGLSRDAQRMGQKTQAIGAIITEP